jgi:hypothetical protein
MFVTRVSIHREGYSYVYGRPDPTKPFRATVEIHGENGKVELNLPADASDKIVALISEEIAAAGRRTAEMLTASALEAQPVAKQITEAK